MTKIIEWNKPFPFVGIHGTHYWCSWEGETKDYWVEFECKPFGLDWSGFQTVVLRYWDHPGRPKARGYWYKVKAFPVK